MRSRLCLAAAMALPLLCPAPAGAAAPTPAGATPSPDTAGQATAPDQHPATRIPEPDTIALFLMGASGLVVGRRLSRTGRKRAPDV